MIQTIPIYIQIREYLLTLINQNKSVEGYKLPSENQLASKFKSSRIPAIKALKALEEEGIIIRHQGQGTYINANSKSIPTKQRVINFIVPGPGSLLVTEIINGIYEFCNNNNIILNITISYGDAETEARQIKYAIESGCSGILLYPVDNDVYSNEILNLVTTDFPVVLIDRKLPGLNISYVSCNHYSQGYNATKCLIDKGHKKIGFISMPLTFASSVYDRFSGHEKAMIDAFSNIDSINILQTPYSDLPIAENAIYNFLNENNFTAIITNNGIASSLVYKFIIEKKLKIPDDISLMLFDNEFKGLEYLIYGKPYYIDQHAYEIGYSAAELLLGLIEKTASRQSIIINESIVDY